MGTVEYIPCQTETSIAGTGKEKQREGRRERENERVLSRKTTIEKGCHLWDTGTAGWEMSRCHVWAVII